MQAPSESQAFWVDEEEINAFSTKSAQTFTSLIRIYRMFASLLALVVFFYIFWQLSPILGGISAVLILTAMISGLIIRRQSLARVEQKKLIQDRARQATGADVIGSAVHVAGHPQLERDQPIVLALKGDELTIHTYQNQVPVAVIRVTEIKALHTVVYDDERIPHIEVIDSTAQALQITLTANGIEHTCLFRRCRKVRPIDWYHAIQRAKAGVGIHPLR